MLVSATNTIFLIPEKLSKNRLCSGIKSKNKMWKVCLD